MVVLREREQLVALRPEDVTQTGGNANERQESVGGLCISRLKTRRKKMVFFGHRWWWEGRETMMFHPRSSLASQRLVDVQTPESL
jgi:hypothetical protein